MDGDVLLSGVGLPALLAVCGAGLGGLFALLRWFAARLRDALLAAYGDLPTNRLAEVMALGFAAASLAGRFDVEADGGRG